MKARHVVHCMAMFALAGLASGIGQHLPQPQPPQWGWNQAGDTRPSASSPAEAALALTPAGMPVVAFQGDVLANDNTCQVRKVFGGAWRGVGGAIPNCRTVSLATEASGAMVLSYYDTAADCPSAKRWTAAGGWQAVGGGCAGTRGWSGAKAVAISPNGSPVLVHGLAQDRETEKGSIAFSRINSTGSWQTTAALFPHWNFAVGSSLAVLPAGGGWPEVAVVLAAGQRKNVPSYRAQAGVYLLAYSWATGKAWKQRVVAGQQPTLFALTQSGPRLVVAVKGTAANAAHAWRIERARFPTFKATQLPPVYPLPPNGPSLYGSDGLDVAVGAEGAIYLVSTDRVHDTINVLKLQANYWQPVGGPLKTAGRLYLAGLAVAPSSSQPYVAAINAPAGGGSGDGLRVWQFGPSE